MKAPDYRTPNIGTDSPEHRARLLRLWESSPGIEDFYVHGS